MLLIVPRLAKVSMKIGGKAVMAFALFIQMVAMGWLGHINTDDTPDRSLWIPLALEGIFVGISIPTLALAAFIRMEDRHATSARETNDARRAVSALRASGKFSFLPFACPECSSYGLSRVE